MTLKYCRQIDATRNKFHVSVDIQETDIASNKNFKIIICKSMSKILITTETRHKQTVYRRSKIEN